MKWYTDIKVVMGVVLAGGLMCLVIGIFWGKDIGERKYKTLTSTNEKRIEIIESRLDSHDRIFPVLVAHTNGIYEYLGVGMMEEIRSVKQDTTITNDFFWDHDPIPPPAGFEMLIDWAIYQKIERPGEWEWNPEMGRWEKSK